MGGIATEVVFILVLIVFNGLLAMSEIAVVSARRARLQKRAESGDAGARAALELADAPTRFLSTVQIGITLVGILAGAFGGATIAEKLDAWLEGVPALAPYSEAASLGLVVVSIAYLSLILGELVPKRLALFNAEGIAALVSRPMRLLARVASPAVKVLTVSTEAVLRLFGARKSDEPPVTEDEVRVMLEQGAHAGVFAHAEKELALNVFRFADRRVSALMTPRHEIAWVDVNAAPAELQRRLGAHRHSRLLVCDGGLDNVVGQVRAKDLLALCLAGEPLDLKSVLRRPLFVPESLPALKALEQLKQTGTHLAVVVDEHGGTQGLFTHHDVMEAIVGGIPSSDNREESPAVRREDGSWLMDGWLPADEVKRLLGVQKLPGEERGDFETLAGLVLMHFGRIPAAGEHFSAGGMYFEVVDMDRRRVDKVLVRLDGQRAASPA
jgi:putative hemolysin